MSVGGRAGDCAVGAAVFGGTVDSGSIGGSRWSHALNPIANAPSNSSDPVRAFIVLSSW
jgi:hypothetical protein